MRGWGRNIAVAAAAGTVLAGAPAAAQSPWLNAVAASEPAGDRAAVSVTPLGAHDDPALSPAVMPSVMPPMAPAVTPPLMFRPAPWTWGRGPAVLSWRADGGPDLGVASGRLALGTATVGKAAAALAPLGHVQVTAVATDLSGQSAADWRAALAGLGAGGGLSPQLAGQSLPGGAVTLSALGQSVTLKHDRDAGVLRLHAPGLGLDLAGPARTVGEAERLLGRWLNGRRDRLTTLVLRRSIAATPDDPLAGNPGSLLYAFTLQPMLLGAPAAGGGAYAFGAPTAVDDSAHFPPTAHYRHDLGAPVEGISAPLALQIPLGGTLTATVAAPISWTRTLAGDDRGSAGLSLGLSAEVAPGWRLGAMLHGGAAGEGGRSLGALTGVSAASAYAVETGETRISLLNSVSGLQSAPLDWQGARHDAELAGMAVRNGVAVDWAAPGFGHAQGRWGVEASDWRWVGTDMHQTHAVEAGVGWRGHDRLGRERAALRLSGVLGDGDGEAVRAGLDLRF